MTVLGEKAVAAAAAMAISIVDVMAALINAQNERRGIPLTPTSQLYTSGKLAQRALFGMRALVAVVVATAGPSVMLTRPALRPLWREP